MQNGQIYLVFARTNEQLFDTWCTSTEIGSSHNKLRQLRLVEECKSCLRPDIKSLVEAARMAGDYSVTLTIRLPLEMNSVLMNYFFKVILVLVFLAFQAPPGKEPKQVTR